MEKIYCFHYDFTDGVKKGKFIKVNDEDLQNIITGKDDFNQFSISLTKKQINYHEKKDDFNQCFKYLYPFLKEDINITDKNINLYLH